MSAPLEVTADNFQSEVMQSDKPVLIDFWAPWCAPCKAISPLLEKMAKDRDDMKIVKVNMDEHPEVGVQFRVRSLPTMIVVKSGNVAGTKTGAVTGKDLESFIQDSLQEPV